MAGLTATQLLYAGIGGGAAALGTAIGSRLRIGGLDLSLVIVAAVLAWRYQVPVGFVIVLASIAVLSAIGTRPLLTIVVGAAGTAATVGGSDLAAALGAASVVVVGLAAAEHVPDRASSAIAAAGLLACLGAVVVGGPDTEASIALAATFGTAAGLRLWSRSPTLQALTPAGAVAVAWISVDAYRGRPAGLPSAVISVAMVVVVLCAASSALLARRRAVQASIVAGASVLALVGARTVGLATSVAPAGYLAAGGSVSLAAMCAWSMAGTREPPARR